MSIWQRLPQPPPAARQAFGFAADLVRQQLERRAKARARAASIMRPYVNLNSGLRKFARLGAPLGLGLLCLVYGFFFALTAPYLIVPFAAPIALLVMMCIWAMPANPHAPTKTMEFFFSAMLICMVLWPNYLALALPGLPWITAIRLTGFPMAILFLVSLSTSKPFRTEVTTVALAIPRLWIWFAAFIAIHVLSLPLATEPGTAVQRAVLQQVNWTIVAAIAAWLCLKPGRVERYVTLLMLMAIPLFIIAFAESAERHLLWNGFVPSFLKIDDALAASIFASIVRSATGLYRAKAVFSTPLGLAEYFGLLMPFAFHFAVSRYSAPIRVLGWLMVPLLFYGVRLTDSRIGVVCFLVTILLYLMFWGMLRFRRNRRDLLAAALVYAYPALFCAGALAITIGPINEMVFGGDAQAASNAARRQQLFMGLPKLLHNPIGFSGGGAGKAMGYAEGAFIAIDNYYLAYGLEYGVIGIVTFLAVFLVTITWSIRALLQLAGRSSREIGLLLPLSVSMSAFLVEKISFAQEDLHPMMFAFLGFAVGLNYRCQQQLRAAQDEWKGPEKIAPPLPLYLRRRPVRQIGA